MKTFIYTLTDPRTNQIRYVGKSNNPQKRYYEHCNKLKRKTYKNNWINELKKCNHKPILEIIDEVPINEWIFWETYWISQIKAWGFILTNNTIGGDGCTFGNQTSFKKGYVPINKGIPLTQEAKDKLRKLNLGKKQTQETKEKRNTKLKGRKVKNLDQLLKNGEKTRFKKGQVPWNKDIIGHKLGGKKKAKPVQQFDLNNNLIAEFLSYSDAAKYTGISGETIRRCCNGKYLKSGGYVWKYKV